MTTEKKGLTIRRGSPLDAVNLYTLLVDEEKRTGSGVAFDVAARLAHIVTVLARGYVTVVTKSGRIVGSVAFTPSEPNYATESFLDCQWCYLIPSLRQSKAAAHLLSKLTDFADLHKMAIRLTLPRVAAASLNPLVLDAGFTETAVTYTRDPQLMVEEEEEDANAGHSGSDAGSRDGDKYAAPEVSAEADDDLDVPTRDELSGLTEES